MPYYQPYWYSNALGYQQAQTSQTLLGYQQAQTLGYQQSLTHASGLANSQ
jgi:hypothetical protein